MKKKILFVFIFLVIVSVALIECYRLKHEEEMRILRVSQANKAFIAKSLDKFKSKFNIKASDVAKVTTEELNNANSKKEEMFTLDLTCNKNCTTVDYDDLNTTIVLTSYDNKGKMQARTVIKPPSYVTYEK